MSKLGAPAITVIIPTYRRPNLLRRAILSVLSQTYTNFLVAVYDNASGDETADVVNGISNEDSRVVYHCHQQNLGAINNFNFGMERVNSPFFSLLGDDNYLRPNFFEEAIDCSHKQGDKALFVGQVENVDEHGRFLSRNLENWPSGLVRAPNGIIHLAESGFPNWEAVLFRRQVIAKHDFLDASFGGAADQEFISRIAEDYDFYVSKSVCAKFTLHSESWTTKRELSEYIENVNRLEERWLKSGNWTARQRTRLRLAARRKIESALRGYVIRNVMVNNDLRTLAAANQFVKNTKKLSKKTIAVVKMANFVNANPGLRWTGTLFAKLDLIRNRVRLLSRNLTSKVTPHSSR